MKANPIVRRGCGIVQTISHLRRYLARQFGSSANHPEISEAVFGIGSMFREITTERKSTALRL